MKADIGDLYIWSPHYKNQHDDPERARRLIANTEMSDRLGGFCSIAKAPVALCEEDQSGGRLGPWVSGKVRVYMIQGLEDASDSAL